MRAEAKTRRDFLKAGAATGFFIAAGRVYGQENRAGEQKLRVLHVGVGGIGKYDERKLLETRRVTFTGMCDTDAERLAAARAQYGGVPGSTDFREMLDKHAGEFDAVCVTTPDHTHALIALEAMKRGKHVYVQKPLARTYRECELLLEAAKKYGVVTQMGNQGHPGVYRYGKLWEENFWGDIQDVHSWTDRPTCWKQGMKTAPEATPKPEGYNWDCWLGPAADRPFSKAYLPTLWRGWRDFGCGAIGDMGVHNMDPAYWLLADMQLPKRVVAWADGKSKVAFPALSTVDMRFGPTGKCPKGFNLYWYERHLRPKPPAGSHIALEIPKNGLIVTGTKATTMGGSHSGTPMCVALAGKTFGEETRDAQRQCGKWMKPPKGVEVAWGYNHYNEWVKACIANDPGKCGSRFEYAVPFTQTLIFGCIAQLLPGEELLWDAEKKCFNNAQATQMLEYVERPGFELRV